MPNELRLERLPSVKSRTGLSRSDIYRRITAGTFPAQIKIGLRSSAWDSREIDRWIQGVLRHAKQVKSD